MTNPRIFTLTHIGDQRMLLDSVEHVFRVAQGGLWLAWNGWTADLADAVQFKDEVDAKLIVLGQPHTVEYGRRWHQAVPVIRNGMLVDTKVGKATVLNVVAAGEAIVKVGDKFYVYCAETGTIIEVREPRWIAVVDNNYVTTNGLSIHRLDALEFFSIDAAIKTAANRQPGSIKILPILP